MSVHYKFKSALDFDTITFDGLHISVSDLKKSIVHQKRLGKTTEFDLQITNAQTKEEYCEETTLIPKNTSLIIARIPLAIQPKKQWDPTAERNASPRVVSDAEVVHADLSRMTGTEEDKIQAMMHQSTMDYDPTNYQKVRGSNQSGEVPSNYRCYKCYKPGHWIKNCPLVAIEPIEVKRNTGIPRSFIEQKKEAEANPLPASVSAATEQKQEIPDDLICNICKDLFTDAVMISCCGNSFCDDCVRTALVESEDNECPDCKEKGTSPGSLIPNRFLRNSVNAFRNETGYNKPRQRRAPSKPEIESKAEEEPVLSPAVEPSEENEDDFKNDMEDIENDEDGMFLELENQNTEEDEYSLKTPPLAEERSGENESDFEDNITVKVPPAHLQSRHAYRERQVNGSRQQRNPGPPGLETPPHQKHKHSQFTNLNHEERSGTPTIDEKDIHYNSSNMNDNRRPIQTTQISQSHSMINSVPHHITSQLPPTTSNHNTYNMNQAQPIQTSYQQHNQPYSNNFNNMPTGFPSSARSFEPHSMGYQGERPRPPFGMRGGYNNPPPMHPHHIRPRHNINPSLAAVYQGVQQQVGTGIIDDPLEAFNRIMREKERRKERRRSPLNRRSRSIDMIDRRRSPDRRRTPENRRGRSPDDRRPRSHERRSEERRRKRSSSYSSRSSRSYSRSKSISPKRHTRSPRKRSRSLIRRTRSRSPSFNISRSKSRSFTPRRTGFKPKPNRSPIRSGSPRFGRFRENIRRNDGNFREDIRERSPSFVNHFNNRGRGGFFRGRGKGNFQNFYRHDRQGQHNIHNNEQMYMQNQEYSDNNQQHGQFSGSFNRFNRDQQYDQRRDYNIHDQHRYDEGNFERNNYQQQQQHHPPDGHQLSFNNLEPPPPGFEPNEPPPRSNWNSNNHNNHPNFEDNKFRDNYNNREFSPENSNYNYREIPLINNDRQIEERRSRTPLDNLLNERHEKVIRSGSNERIRNEHEHKEKKRRSRSKTLEKHDSRKHADSNKDKYKDDHHKKRPDMSKDKKEMEKKVSDKENKKEDKDREKKRESSDDEKRDKKSSKEKKKRKKEKEAEKKKNKKERKEKEKRGKESKKTSSQEKTDDTKDEEVENAIEKAIATPPIIETADSRKAIAESDIRHNSNDKEKELEESNDKHEDISADLYDDLDEEQVKIDSSDIYAETDPSINNDPQSASPTAATRTDFLEIDNNVLDFEPEFYDQENDSTRKQSNMFVALPEPSKWELEEESQMSTDKKVLPNDSDSPEDRSGKVTNEVLKRAENAIFARAINAIRPIEIKKISVERQKLYSNEMAQDESPVSTIVVTKQVAHDNMVDMPIDNQYIDEPQENLLHTPIIHSFQITVPTNSDNVERSVEIKTEVLHEKVKGRASPIRGSVKERLGSKVLETNKSRSKTPMKRNKSADSNKNNINRSTERSRSNDRRSHDRNNKRTNETQSRDQEEQGSKNRDDRNYRAQDDLSNRNRDMGTHQRRMDDRNRNINRMQDERGRNRNRNERNDRNFNNRNEIRNENRSGGRFDTNLSKDRVDNRFNNRNPNRKDDNNSGRDRNRDDKFKFNNSNNDHRNNNNNNNNKSKDNKVDKNREKSKERKKMRSKSNSSIERKHKKDKKQNKRDKDDNKKKFSEDRKLADKKEENGKNASELNAAEMKNSDRNLSDDKKRQATNEMRPTLSTSAHPESDSGKDKSKNDSRKRSIDKDGKGAKDEVLSKKSKLEKSDKKHDTSNTSATSSSSSDSDSSESSTGTDDKKKKKRKHKKEKKRSRRSSSTDSETSGKRKKTNKKKSKSAKKKKKSKHK